MKKTIAILLSLCLLSTLISCSSQKPIESTTTATEEIAQDVVSQTTTLQYTVETSSSNENQVVEQPGPKMEKHEIELSLDNYLMYFNVTESILNYSSPYTFAGCLSYAYYDNVIVTIEYTNDSSGSKQTKKILLNAAGNGTAPETRCETAKIVGISGTVIFWM